MRAFQEGTYHNIPDFWELWIRLRHSLARAMNTREQGYVERTINHQMEATEAIIGNIRALSIFNVDDLYDQRDLTVMMDCELPGNPLPEEFTRLGPLQKAFSIQCN